MPDAAEKHVLCIYSTALLPMDLTMQQPMNSLRAINQEIEVAQLKVKPDFLSMADHLKSDFLCINTTTGDNQTLKLWFWLSHDVSRITRIARFELPDFEDAVVFLITDPDGIPGNLPVLMNFYRQQFEEEFKEVIEQFSWYIPKKPFEYSCWVE